MQVKEFESQLQERQKCLAECKEKVTLPIQLFYYRIMYCKSSSDSPLIPEEESCYTLSLYKDPTTNPLKCTRHLLLGNMCMSYVHVHIRSVVLIM